MSTSVLMLLQTLHEQGKLLNGCVSSYQTSCENVLRKISLLIVSTEGCQQAQILIMHITCRDQSADTRLLSGAGLSGGADDAKEESSLTHLQW